MPPSTMLRLLWASTILSASALSSIPASVLTGNPARFKALSTEAFRHPLDLQNTRRVQGSTFSAGLERLVRTFTRQAEQSIYLDNLSTAVRVGPAQLPDLHAQLVDACECLGVAKVPDLYVRQNPAPNAYTLAANGERPFIVVHSSLLEMCSPAEVATVARKPLTKHFLCSCHTIRHSHLTTNMSANVC